MTSPPPNIIERRPVLVLDLDGTVRCSKQGRIDRPDGDYDPPIGPEDVALYDSVESVIACHKFWHKAYVIGVTNQGWVGKGQQTVEWSQAVELATRAAFEDDPFDAIYSSYAYHSDGPHTPHNRRSLLRKPAYGMLAAAEHDALRHGIALDWDHPATVMVGDFASDRDCAAAAGIRFRWAWDFFPGRGAPAKVPT